MHQVSLYRLSLPPELRHARVTLVSDGHGSRANPLALRYLLDHSIDLGVLRLRNLFSCIRKLSNCKEKSDISDFVSGLVQTGEVKVFKAICPWHVANIGVRDGHATYEMLNGKSKVMLGLGKVEEFPNCV